MQTNKNINRYIAISLLLHLCIFAVLALSVHYRKSNSENNTLEVSILTPEEAAELRDAPDAKTIVETDSRKANDKLNEKAKFLSEKSNSVDKETRAKFGKEFKNTKGFSSGNNANRAARNLNKDSATQAKNQADANKKSEKADIFKNDFDPYASLTKEAEGKKTENKTAEQKQLPKERTPGSADGGSDLATTNDNLKNIENEFLTRLNTKEYKYFGYYNRIKTQLNQWWVPQVQQRFSKMVRQGRMIASEESKVTKLVIVLSDQGQLVKVQVLAESGVRDLDEAAVEAFRQAAPFPNPPKGMIDSDGTVKIRWDCVVES